MALRDRLWEGIRRAIPDVRLNGHPVRRLPNTLSVAFPGAAGESVLVATADEAYDVLRDDLRNGDVVLVKSSGSAELRFLGDRIAGVTA